MFFSNPVDGEYCTYIVYEKGWVPDQGNTFLKVSILKRGPLSSQDEINKA